MNTIEMKYSLFKDIDAINDEAVLYRLTALVKKILLMPQYYKEEDIDAEEEDDDIDYNFGGIDFGYPKTFEEVEAELEKAEAERDDPTKWTTFPQFMSDFKREHQAWFK